MAEAAAVIHRRAISWKSLLALAVFCVPAPALTVHAAQLDIAGPAGSNAFGKSVTVLPNGNIVVADSDFSTADLAHVGAVYLYSPSATLITTLKGSHAEDHVGFGIVVLKNGHFVVVSPYWQSGDVTNAGAVTWVDADAGLDGFVSTANSLTGTSPNDYVGGFNRGVIALANGNYVVRSRLWNNGAATSAGAVTWLDGSAGFSGTVSSANSLVGTSDNEGDGLNVTRLKNGNYVVENMRWSNGSVMNAGAATWGDGTKGVSGTASAANSLVGSSADDGIGAGVLALTNGNYVVSNLNWDNGSIMNAGAVTWGDGTTGVVGTVSPANSLVGSTAYDVIGGVTPLSNGNYVVYSSFWDNGDVEDAGAVTWANGSVGLSGAVSVDNSLVGTSAGDFVGGGGGSYYLPGVYALTNGNYVIASPKWSNNTPFGAFGAVTWGDGTQGTRGVVSPDNSLVGTTQGDAVGSGVSAYYLPGVFPLSNGNYVVASPQWHNAGASNAGAVTWASGVAGVTGAVSVANSLVGTVAGDALGGGSSEFFAPGVTALADGNYVIDSPAWNDGAAIHAGAATWASGISGLTGVVTSANSLIGDDAYSDVGSSGITALTNGNYVVGSAFWKNGSVLSAGAVTWASGLAGVSGTVSAANSLVGTNDYDQVGQGGIFAMSDGNYVVVSPRWQNGGSAVAGAVTLASGRFRTSGTIQAYNSVLGAAAGGGLDLVFAYDAVRHQLVVGRPADNIVSLFTMDQVFADSFE